MDSGPPERRETKRFLFDEPLNGFIGRVPVVILDVSHSALGISHHEEIGGVGETCFVRLVLRGRSVSLRCAIIRSDLQRVGSAAFAHSLRHTALRILDTLGDGDEVLKEILGPIPETD